MKSVVTLVLLLTLVGLPNLLAARDATLRGVPGQPQIGGLRICDSDCSSGLQGIGWSTSDDALIRMDRLDGQGDVLALEEFNWSAQPGPLMATAGSGVWSGQDETKWPGSIFFHGRDGFSSHFYFPAIESGPSESGPSEFGKESVQWGIFLARPNRLGSGTGPGLTGWIDRPRQVYLGSDGVLEFIPGEGSFSVTGPAWLGLRDRFHALTLKVSDQAHAVPNVDDYGLALRLPGADAKAVDLYSGPLWRSDLRRADVLLPGLMFSEYGNGLRALGNAFQWLLDLLGSAIGSTAGAILLLALLVSLALWPLAHLLGKPVGNPRNDSLRSLVLLIIRGILLFGAVIAIAYYYPTREEVFFWIRDLSQPDLVALLPVQIPFPDWLGISNEMFALPFVFLIVYWMAMSAMSNARVRLGGRAMPGYLGLLVGLLAFALCYTLPASVVLYLVTLALLAWGKAILTRPGVKVATSAASSVRSRAE